MNVGKFLRRRAETRFEPSASSQQQTTQEESQTSQSGSAQHYSYQSPPSHVVKPQLPTQTLPPHVQRTMIAAPSPGQEELIACMSALSDSVCQLTARLDGMEASAAVAVGEMKALVERVMDHRPEARQQSAIEREELGESDSSDTVGTGGSAASSYVDPDEITLTEYHRARKKVGAGTPLRVVKRKHTDTLFMEMG